MDYFMSVRGRAGDGYSNRIGGTKFLAVPDGADELKKDHEIGLGQWWRDVQAAAGGTVENKGHLTVFVHGFNTDQFDMLERHRKIRDGLAAEGYPGIVVGFDWPSNGSVLGYASDRRDARRAAEQLFDDGLARFSKLQTSDCVVNLHVLAHSMGCFVVREAFDYADDDHVTAQSNWTVSQVALVAADISSKNMNATSAKVSSLYRHSTRVTAYWSAFDEILSISEIKRVGVSRRLGRVGLPDDIPGSAVDLYCGQFFAQTKDQYPAGASASHSWYFDAPRFYEDLTHTLLGKLDRHVIPTRGRTDRGGLGLA